MKVTRLSSILHRFKLWQICSGAILLCVCCRLLYSVADSWPLWDSQRFHFACLGQLANYLASCTATDLSKCLMGKTAICSESLSNLTCQSIWLSKPQLISLPLIESSAYGKTDPQTTLKTHKILTEKQVVGSISFTGESPSTGILLHQDFFNSIALLFI